MLCAEETLLTPNESKILFTTIFTIGTLKIRNRILFKSKLISKTNYIKYERKDLNRPIIENSKNVESLQNLFHLLEYFCYEKKNNKKNKLVKRDPELIIDTKQMIKEKTPWAHQFDSKKSVFDIIAVEKTNLSNGLTFELCEEDLLKCLLFYPINLDNVLNLKKGLLINQNKYYDNPLEKEKKKTLVSTIHSAYY